MAKKIKVTNFVREGMNLVKDNIPQLKSVWHMLNMHLKDANEQIYLLIFKNDGTCIAKENISADAGTASSVAINQEKVVDIMEAMLKLGYTKWGMAHNHPIVMSSGEEVKTYISDGDINMTQIMKNAVWQIDESFEFVDHYVINEEGGHARIMSIEHEFNFNMDVIDKAEKGI